MKNLYAAVLTGTALLLSGTMDAQAGLSIKSHGTFRSANLINTAALPHHGTANDNRGGGAPLNDACGSATTVVLAAGSSIAFAGDNTNATEDGDFEPGSGLEGFGAVVWHKFSTSECTDVTVSYCATSPGFGNVAAFLARTCPATDADYVLYSTGDFTTCSAGDNATLHFDNLAAGEYYFPVLMDTTAANYAVGPYNIEISATACALPPANDECSGAVNLIPSADCVPVPGTTNAATESLPAILCNGYTSPNALDVWYFFTATQTNHTVTIEGLENFDAVMELFSGDCTDLTSILCGDPTFPNPDPVTEVTPLTGLTIGQTYYLRVYDYAHGSTGHNFNICITTGVPPAEYCVPTQADVTGGDFIANVTLGTIDNATLGDNNYEDYTAQSTMLEQGGTYTLSITSGDYGMDYYAAWIDYNRDTTFQATEKLGEFEGTTPGELIELTFTVPVDATLGTTRLRVRGAYGAMDMEPCVEYLYGEIEDYHVEITIPTGVREYNSANVSVYPNPSNGNITIGGADLSGTVNLQIIDMTGRVVYQEQKTMTAGQPATLALNGKLAQGTYSLRVITANGISSRAVMIK